MQSAALLAYENHELREANEKMKKKRDKNIEDSYPEPLVKNLGPGGGQSIIYAALP
jgi:hypothetical protein